MAPTLTDNRARTAPLNVFIQAFACLQISLYVCLYIATPGYIVPFFNNPLARSFLIGFVVWEILGFALLYRFCPPGKRIVTIAAATFVSVVSAGPLTVAPLLGPAIVTIPGCYLGVLIERPSRACLRHPR